MRKSLFLSVSFSCIVSSLGATTANAALQSPFPSTQLSKSGKHTAIPDLPPQVDVLGVSYYTDDKHSVADPQKEEANNAALDPIRKFARTVSALADKEDDGASRAAIQLMASWAAANGLLGQVNKQGESEREWTLCVLSLTYLRVRNVDGMNAEKQQIQNWLSRLAQTVEPNYETSTAKWNNRAYWAGLAVSATGVAANDRQLYDWGMIRALTGANAIQDDGTLPLEMARGQRALSYHLYAMTPLVMLAEMSEANGVNLYKINNGGINRLADRVIKGLSDPDWFSQKAGVAQESPDKYNAQDFAWMEPYYARFHDGRLLPWLQMKRPLIVRTAGGNLTEIYGK
jgi:poly(beta-D-mannuronate) lyase